MHAEVLDEPELEFGGGTRHIDPRFGIATYGPADLLAPDAPHAVRIGLIGPADQLDGLGTWLERCREPIPAKDERYPHLFPEFPGCDIDIGLHSTLVLSNRNTRTISSSALRAIENAPTESALPRAVDAYAEEIISLAEENRVDVLLIARPEQLADVARRGGRRTRRTSPSARASDEGLPRFANFHDLLKARLLHLRQPIQIIRRSSWDEAHPPPVGYGRQDEASRAWNLHVALYYKAGGVPWRLLRNPTDLTTCYVGVSFYRNSDDTSLDTAVAQIFNERGDGVIVRGGPARITGSDKQPHLNRDDARQLLLSALDAYGASTAPCRRGRAAQKLGFHRRRDRRIRRRRGRTADRHARDGVDHHQRRCPALPRRAPGAAAARDDARIVPTVSLSSTPLEAWSSTPPTLVTTCRSPSASARPIRCAAPVRPAPRPWP